MGYKCRVHVGEDGENGDKMVWGWWWKKGYIKEWKKRDEEDNNNKMEK